MYLGNIKVIGELSTAGEKSDFGFPFQGILITYKYVPDCELIMVVLVTISKR